MLKTLPLVYILIGFGIIAFVLVNYSPVKIDLPGLEGLKITGTNQSSKITTPAPTPYYGPRPETVIISGPKDWELVEDSSVVVFQFVAIWGGEQRGLVFETKVDEIDSDWQLTLTNSRAVNLLPGERTYRFYVRAKTADGIVDETPAYRVFRARLSDKVGEVKINVVSAQSSLQKMVVLNRTDRTIDLTDWTIESNYRKYTISSAVKLFRLSSSLNWGKIIFSPGESLIVIGANSPLAVNFYLNRCFGYLANSYNFYNIFRLDCPRPSESEIAYLSKECQFYVNNLGTCQTPSQFDINRFANDFSCQNFLSNYYNYEACVNRYQNNSDFFKKEWYVFTGSNFADAQHDKIILRDEKGLVVDSFQY